LTFLSLFIYFYDTYNLYFIDIVDGNTKIILGMLWRLINRFQLSADNSRTWLLNWCAEVTSSYEKVNITNFHSSFQDGLAFCALLHYYDKTFLDFDSLDSDDGIRNVRLAFNIAEEQLEIPQLLDPSDITKGLADERSVMTYLSMIKKAFDHRTTGGVVKMKQDFSIAPVEAATPVTVSTPVVNDTTESAKEPTEIVRIESSPQDQEKIQQLTVQNHQLKEEIVSLNKEITTLKETNQNLLQTNETLRAQITTEMENDSEDSEDSVPVPAVSSRAIPAIVVTLPDDETHEEPVEVKLDIPVKDINDNEETAKEEPEKEGEPAKEKPAEPEKEKPSEEPESDNQEPAKEGDATSGDEEKKGKLAKKVKRQTRVIYQLQNSNAELTKEIDETREKLLQQVKVSETLQKNLEDTREEIMLVQKKQKKSQDRAFKKVQRRSEKKIARRDKEIETLKTTHQIEIQKKASEIETLRRQLKKIQEALGGSMAPKPAIIEADVQALQAEKDDLFSLVRAFEAEELAIQARIRKEQEEAEEALDV